MSVCRANRQLGQSFAEFLLVITSVALVAMLGFGVMNASVGSQSASVAEALAGGTPKPEVRFEEVVNSSGLSLVDFDSVNAAAKNTANTSDENGSIAFGQGFVSGLIENLWAELSALLNPVDTALALAELGRLLATETVATLQLLYDELVAKQIDKLVNGNDFERGFVLGNQVSALKAVSVLAKASGAAVLVGIAKRTDDADGVPNAKGTFRDANGRLRNSDGTFAYDGGRKRSTGGTHGNTAGDQPATLYERYDADGNFLKHGISQDPSRR